jgi:hydrogenase maturation protease
VNSPRSTLFAGLGSPHGDDQVGWLVADQLAKSKNLPRHLSIRKAAIPLDLLDWLQGVEILGLCDAAETSKETGKLERWEWNANLPRTRDTTISNALLPMFKRLRIPGSHDFGIAEVFDLAERLDRLPARIVVWTISASQFGTGQPLSGELQRILPIVSKTILTELSHA